MALSARKYLTAFCSQHSWLAVLQPRSIDCITVARWLACPRAEHEGERMSKSGLLGLLTGPNPKETGQSSEELASVLKRRMVRQMAIWVAIGVVGAVTLLWLRGV